MEKEKSFWRRFLKGLKNSTLGFLIATAAQFVAMSIFETVKGVIEYFYLDADNRFYKDYPYLVDYELGVLQRIVAFNKHRFFGWKEERIRKYFDEKKSIKGDKWAEEEIRKDLKMAT